MDATTLHRLLERHPGEGGFKRHTDNQLDSDLLVVDKARMVDVMLMHATLKALPRQVALLPTGKALVDIDKLTHAVPQDDGGTRLFLGAQQLDVPHTQEELENVLAGRERGDAGEGSRAGFRIE